MSKIAKFESATFLASEDLPKLQKFTDVCMVGSTNVQNFTTLRSCIFITFQQITFKLGNFTHFKALLFSGSDGFSRTCP